jgi:hypothetical protein
VALRRVGRSMVGRRDEEKASAGFRSFNPSGIQNPWMRIQNEGGESRGSECENRGAQRETTTVL